MVRAASIGSSIAVLTALIAVSGATRAHGNAPPTRVWVISQGTLTGVQLSTRGGPEVEPERNQRTGAEGRIVVRAGRYWFQQLAGPLLPIEPLESWGPSAQHLSRAATALFAAQRGSGGPDALPEHELRRADEYLRLAWTSRPRISAQTLRPFENALARTLLTLAAARRSGSVSATPRLLAGTQQMIAAARRTLTPAGQGVALRVVPNGIGLEATVGQTDTNGPISITNTGNTPLTYTVTPPPAATPFTVLGALSGDLPVGGAGAELSVQFTPPFDGEFESLVVIDSPGQLAATVILEGKGTGGAFEVKPTRLKFPNTEVGEISSLRVSIKRRDTVQNFSTTDAPIAEFTAPTGPLDLTNKRARFDVTFSPSGAADYEDHMRLNHASIAGGFFQLPLTGKGIGRVSALPNRLDYGTVAANVFHFREMVISNSTDEAVAVEGSTLKLEPKHFEITGLGAFMLDPGESREIVVRFGATNKCKHKGSLIFTSEAFPKGSLKVPVSVKAEVL